MRRIKNKTENKIENKQYNFDHNTLTLFMNMFNNMPVKELISGIYKDCVHPDTLEQYKFWLSLSDLEQNNIANVVSCGNSVKVSVTFDF